MEKTASHLSEISPALTWDLSWVGWIRSHINDLLLQSEIRHSAEISLRWDVSPGWDYFSHINTICIHTEKQTADMSVKSFEFVAAVYVFHVYRDIWLPYIKETLKYLHELEMLMMYLQSSAWKEIRLLCIFLEMSRPTKYLDQQNTF